jgi:hypothetical protein
MQGQRPQVTIGPSLDGLIFCRAILTIWPEEVGGRSLEMSELSQSRRIGQVPAAVAVGTRVTSRPPQRSVRAQFGHTAPTLGV